jgi:hypothetical protein
MQKLFIRLLGLLMGVGTVALGLWLFSTYTWGVSVALRSPGWPTTMGVVIASDVCEHYGKSGTTYAPCLTYRYSVNNKIFESSLITGAHRDSGLREDAELTAQKYAVGTRVKVSYDPSSPGIACLEPGVVPWEAYVAIIVGLALTAFGFFLLLLYLANLKALRLKTRSPG